MALRRRYQRKRAWRLALTFVIVGLVATTAPPSVADPVGDHETTTEHARLSMTSDHYDWGIAFRLGKFWTEGAPWGELHVCWKLENTHATQTIELGLLNAYTITDDQGREVFVNLHWQQATDPIPPGDARYGCWWGNTEPEYPDAVQRGLDREAPPGQYALIYHYSSGPRGDTQSSSISLAFEVADDHGLYAAGVP